MKVRMLLLLMSALSVACAAPLASQEQVSVRAATDSGIGVQPVSRRRVFVARTLSGALFGGIGGVTGLASAQRCDDCNLPSGQAVAAAAVGLIVGTAIGVTLPRYQSSCAASRRFFRALGGATPGIILVVIVGPFGPALGGTWAQGRC